MLPRIVRFDSWNPDTRAQTTPANATERDFTAGITYLIDGGALRFQANYVRQSFANGLAPSQNMVRFNIQTAW